MVKIYRLAMLYEIHDTYTFRGFAYGRTPEECNLVWKDDDLSNACEPECEHIEVSYAEAQRLLPDPLYIKLLRREV